MGLCLGRSAGADVDNNLFLNNDVYGNSLGVGLDLNEAGNDGNEFVNNIISGNTKSGVAANYGFYISDRTSTVAGDITINYNDWYDNSTNLQDDSGLDPAYVVGGNAVVADPLFVNPTAGTADGFKLRSKSPCRGAGTNLSATFTRGISPRGWPKTDLRGSEWDIGAYVYVPSRWELLWDRMFNTGRWSGMN